MKQEKHLISLEAKSIAPLCPEAAHLAKGLIEHLREHRGTLNPIQVTEAIIKVLTGHVATCRRRDQSAGEIGAGLAGVVFADYMAAHQHMTGMEAKLEPGG